MEKNVSKTHRVNNVNLYPRDIYHAYKVHTACGSEILLKNSQEGTIALYCPKCNLFLTSFTAIRDMTNSEICEYL